MVAAVAVVAMAAVAAAVVAMAAVVVVVVATAVAVAVAATVAAATTTDRCADETEKPRRLAGFFYACAVQLPCSPRKFRRHSSAKSIFSVSAGLEFNRLTGDPTMKAPVRRLLTSTLLIALAACTHAPTPTSAPKPAALAVAPAAKKTDAPPVSDAATLAALDQALLSSTRSEANRARDAARHPRETLAFFGLRSDMTVMEVWPGGNGWYAEILAPVLQAHGRYIAAEHDPKSSAYAQETVRALKAKLDAAPELYGQVQLVSLQAPDALSAVAPGSVDLVLTFRNLHNWLWKTDAAPAMLKAMLAALKPGGILGIVDHRADPMAPLDPNAKLGYVNEHFAIQLAEQAGFEFLGASEINANPRDTRDYEQGVWTLPPTYRLGDKDRERYTAIGESDRFTLRFRKPLAAR